MYNNVSEWLTDICDAVREKDSTTEIINHVDIPDRIRRIKPPSNYGLITFTAIIPTTAEIKVS